MTSFAFNWPSSGRTCASKRARFVGIEAYEAAGGGVLRDLFESDDGGWLQDVGLLDRLVTEKLTAIADEIAGEGWKWVEAAVSLPYGVAAGLRAFTGTPLDLTAEEEATIAALTAENDRLVAEYENADELPDAVWSPAARRVRRRAAPRRASARSRSDWRATGRSRTG